MTRPTIRVELDLPDIVMPVSIGGREPVDLEPHELNRWMAEIEVDCKERSNEVKQTNKDGGITDEEWKWTMFRCRLADKLGEKAPGKLRMHQVVDCFNMAVAIIEAEAEASKKKRDETQGLLLSTLGCPAIISGGQTSERTAGSSTPMPSQRSGNGSAPCSATTARNEPTQPN